MSNPLKLTIPNPETFRTKITGKLNVLLKNDKINCEFHILPFSNKAKMTSDRNNFGFEIRILLFQITSFSSFLIFLL